MNPADVLVAFAVGIIGGLLAAGGLLALLRTRPRHRRRRRTLREDLEDDDGWN